MRTKKASMFGSDYVKNPDPVPVKEERSWQAVVVIKTKVDKLPRLDSSVWTFKLGKHETLFEAEKAFQQLGFTIPSTAHVIIEDENKIESKIK
jgi:hypothetical protein